MSALLHLIPALICIAIGAVGANEMSQSLDRETPLDMAKGLGLVTLAFIGAAVSLSEALSFAISHAMGGAR
jgi:hypothetical protein